MLTNEWKCVSNNKNSAYPDIYSYKTEESDSLHLNVNKKKGILEFLITTNDGREYKSVISNGVIIEERDLHSGKSDYLEYIFNRYAQELSTIGDDIVLRIIGNNYGVLQGEKSKSAIIKYNKQTTFNKFIIKVVESTVNYLKALLEKPSMTDLFDISLILGIGYTVLQINYDYLQTGLITCGAAIFSGYYDWIIRNKGPHILKILCVTIIGYYTTYLGMSYQ